MYQLTRDNLAVNGFYATSVGHCVALSDTPGTVKMRTFPGYLATSSLRPMTTEFVDATAALTGRQSVMIDVQMARLDDLMHNIAKIDVLKIDVEGHEPAVMRGAVEILKRSKTIKMVMEFVPGLMTRDEALAHLALMRELGFSIFRIEDDASLTAQPSDEALLSIAFSDLFLMRI
jgi:FkbM family methyltransferase